METIAERRKRRLIWLCSQKGGHVAVATAAGVSAAALDQIIKGVELPAKKDGTRSARGLGSPMARAIEAAYPELVKGWFDADDVAALMLTPEEIDWVMAQREYKARKIAAAGPPPSTDRGSDTDSGTMMSRPQETATGMPVSFVERRSTPPAPQKHTLYRRGVKVHVNPMSKDDPRPVPGEFPLRRHDDKPTLKPAHPSKKKPGADK
jgi:hypothetical protein